MCIKWIKNVFQYEKIPEETSEKETNENHNKTDFLKEQKIKFKKWYLSEFKEELQDNCFKSLLESES